MPQRLTDFEQAFIAAILEAEATPRVQLPVRLDRMTVGERSFSFYGFFTAIQDTPEAVLWQEPLNARLGAQVVATVNGDEDIGGVLYIDEGKLTMLEGFTYSGNEWPREVREFAFDAPSPGSTIGLRPASPQDEEWASSNFDPSQTYEEWAAHNAHEYAMFNFDKIKYRDPKMHAWVQGLARWLFAPDLAARLRAARKKYLSPSRMAEVEALERDPF